MIEVTLDRGAAAASSARCTRAGTLVERDVAQLIVVFTRPIAHTILERVNPKDATGRVPDGEQLLRARKIKIVDVDHFSQGIDAPCRYGGSAQDHLAERHAHRNRSVRSFIELANRVCVIVRVGEHPRTRYAVPDAVVSGHTCLTRR